MHEYQSKSGDAKPSCAGALLAAVALAGLSAGQAMGASGTWDGGGDGTSWTDPANWNVPTPPGDTDSAASTTTRVASFDSAGNSIFT